MERWRDDAAVGGPAVTETPAQVRQREMHVPAAQQQFGGIERTRRHDHAVRHQTFRHRRVVRDAVEMDAISAILGRDARDHVQWANVGALRLSGGEVVDV